MSTQHHNPAGLKIIGILKLLTASLLILGGIGAFHLMNRDIGEIAKRLLALLDLDPKNGFLNKMLGHVTNLTPNDFKKIGIGTFLYAVLYVVEGVGLMKAKRWAEYLTIIITASLLPFEGYEVLLRAGVIRITALVINLVIVIYLIWQLKWGKK